ncbi:hypothetical protein AAMO2058_001217500 [Amorphochlora amoebiformis]
MFLVVNSAHIGMGPLFLLVALADGVRVPPEDFGGRQSVLERELETRHGAGLDVCEKLRRGSDIDIVVSVPVYEEMWYLRDMVRNFLIFTEPSTALVLHLNVRTPYTPKELDEIKSFSPRVWINPKRVYVHPWTGSLFLAHVLNMEYALSRPDSQLSHVVTYASNARLLKVGMEAYIRKHHASLGYGPQERHWKGVDLVPAVPDPFMKWLVRVYSSWKKNVNELFGAGFKKMIQLKPEGAFYPASVMQSLVSKLRESNTALANAKVAPTFLEEFIFPSWAAHMIPPCADDSNPNDCQGTGHNIIDVLSISSNRNGTWTPTPEEIRKNVMAVDTLFGVKSISRHHKDFHGTRKYIHSLEESKAKDRCDG